MSSPPSLKSLEREIPRQFLLRLKLLWGAVRITHFSYPPKLCYAADAGLLMRLGKAQVDRQEQSSRTTVHPTHPLVRPQDQNPLVVQQAKQGAGPKTARHVGRKVELTRGGTVERYPDHDGTPTDLWHLRASLCHCTELRPTRDECY